MRPRYVAATAALVWLLVVFALSGCRTMAPGLVVPAAGAHETQRVTFASESVEWRVEDDVLLVTMPIRQLGWTALGFDGGPGIAGADVIVLRSDRFGVSPVDATVVRAYSCQPDVRAGGANQLRLVSLEEGRATISKPLSGDVADVELAAGREVRIFLSQGIFGVTEYPLLKRIETRIEL